MIFLSNVYFPRVHSYTAGPYSCCRCQIRNVAGALDVDQIIEDTAAMDRVSGLMDAVAVQVCI